MGVSSFWRQQGSILGGCSEAQPINDELGLRKTQRSDGLVSKPARQSRGQRPSAHRHRRRRHASWCLCFMPRRPNFFDFLFFFPRNGWQLSRSHTSRIPSRHAKYTEHTTRLRLTTAHHPPNQTPARRGLVSLSYEVLYVLCGRVYCPAQPNIRCLPCFVLHATPAERSDQGRC